MDAKKIIFLILFFISIIFCNYSFAESKANVFLTSNKSTIRKGEEVEISINIENNTICAYDLNLYFDTSKFEYIKEDELSNLKDDHIISLWYDETGGSNPKTGIIKTFKFRAKEEGSGYFIVNGNFYTKNGQKINTSFRETSVEIKENIKQERITKEGTETNPSNSSLQGLSLNIEGITPEFKSDVYKYYVTVPTSINNILVTVTPSNKDANVTVTGNTNLKNGLNIININVTSVDNTNTTSYEIYVTKTDDKDSTNTNLETLAIENTLLNNIFDNSITNYNIEVGNSVDSLNILAIPEDGNASVEINKSNTFQEGNNTIKVTVTAKNGYTKKEYIINVYKRNNEEEQSYNQEQEDNKNKLNSIYETEKTSNEQIKEQQNQEEVIIENKETQENKTTKSIKDIVIIISLLILILIIGISVIWYKKKRQKKI